MKYHFENYKNCKWHYDDGVFFPVVEKLTVEDGNDTYDPTLDNEFADVVSWFSGYLSDILFESKIGRPDMILFYIKKEYSGMYRPGNKINIKSTKYTRSGESIFFPVTSYLRRKNKWATSVEMNHPPHIYMIPHFSHIKGFDIVHKNGHNVVGRYGFDELHDRNIKRSSILSSFWTISPEWKIFNSFCYPCVNLSQCYASGDVAYGRDFSSRKCLGFSAVVEKKSVEPEEYLEDLVRINHGYNVEGLEESDFQ